MTSPDNFGADSDGTLFYIRDVINTLNSEAGQREADSVGMHETSAISAYDQCVARLADDYGRMREQLRTGSASLYEARAAQRAERELIQAAAAAGESERLDQLVAQLAERRDWPDAEPDEIAPGLLIAASVGHVGAKNLLDNLLAAEEAKMRENRPSDHWLNPDYSRVMRAVTDTCAEAGISATDWIERHTRYGLRQWGAYMGYMISIDYNPDFPADERRAIELKVANIIHTELNYPKVNSMAPSHLSLMTDPTARKKVMEAYIESLSPAPKTGFWVIGLEKMFSVLSKEPELIDRPEVIELLPVILDEAQTALNSPAVGRWTADEIIAKGGSPREAIARLDLLYGRIEATGGRQSITFSRETILQEYAEHFAQKGDFGSARAFLDAIGNTADYNAAATACLKHAREDRDVATMHPDETALMVSPARSIPFTIDRARRSGNSQEFIDAVIAIAEDTAEPENPKAAGFLGALISNVASGGAAEIMQGMLNESSSEYRRDGILKDAFYQTLKQDPAQALTLGQRMLATLRQGPTARNAEIINDISAEVIHLGDRDELARRYSEAESMEPGADRARQLAWLLRITPKR